jgi:phage terminase Nu1 subunit (DNA packaging protein)
MFLLWQAAKPSGMKNKKAYGFIISTSVCMFHIHAYQRAVCGALSSSCKMGEQAV